MILLETGFPAILLWWEGKGEFRVWKLLVKHTRHSRPHGNRGLPIRRGVRGSCSQLQEEGGRPRDAVLGRIMHNLRIQKSPGGSHHEHTG